MKKQIKLTMTMIMAVCLCASSALLAANGQWTFDGDGQWTNAAMWGGGNVPNGVGDNAYFTANYTDDRITASTENSDKIIIGGIYLNNIRVQIPAADSDPGFPGATNLVLDAGGGSPIIDVCSNRLDIQIPLDGTDGFTTRGYHDSGVLMLGRTPKPISGNVNLYDISEVIINNSNALQNADVTITGTTVRVRKDTFNTKSLNIGDAGSLNFTEQITVEIVGNPINVNYNGKLLIGMNNSTLSGSNITVNGISPVNGGQLETTVALATNTVPLTLSGYGGNWLGAILMSSGNQTFVVNAPVTLAGNTRVGGYSSGVRHLYLKKDISGTGLLELWAGGGHATHGVYLYLGGSNTYAGKTSIYSGYGAVSRLILESSNALPDNQILDLNGYNVDWPNPSEVDVNGNAETLKSLSMPDATIKNIFDSGSGGKLTLTDTSDNTGGVVQDDGVLNLSADIDLPNGPYHLSGSSVLNLTNATIDCKSLGQFRIGWAGTGTTTANINDGGKVDCYGVRLSEVNNTPIVNINSGGEINCAEIYVGNGTPSSGEFNIDGGTLSDSDVSTTLTNWIRSLANVTFAIKAGGATFNVDNQYRAVNEVITGSAGGDLTKIGSETLAFEVAPTFDGDININAGKVVFNCDVSGLSGNINVASGAKIGGTGTLPAMIIPNGVTVAPGNSIGTLNTGTLELQAGSEYDWEVGTASSADLINVNGNLTIPAGGMTVNVIDAGSPDGSACTLFQTSFIFGNVANINMSYGVGVAGPDHPTQVGDNIVAGIIPEPATFGLLAILGIAFLRRK